MNYDDSTLLLRFARLHLEIAIARNPAAQMNITSGEVQRSAGFRKLRAWFVKLSPFAKSKARRWMRENIEGVRMVMAKAAASGERFSLADVEISAIEEVEPTT